MKVFAGFEYYEDDFIGFFVDPYVDKSMTREAVDVIICGGIEDGCDELAKAANRYGMCSHQMTSAMAKYGWRLVSTEITTIDGFTYYPFEQGE